MNGFKHNYGLKIGDIDENGSKIEYIYECETGKYFLYHIKGFDLQIIAEDETLIGKNAKFNKLILQIGDYLSNEPALRGLYITHMVHAVKNLFDGNEDSAVETLASTYDSMTRYLKRHAVIPYLLGAFVLVFISLIAYFVSYKFGWLSSFENTLFSAVVLAALGGFLSVAISLRNISVEVQDNFGVKAIYGVVRIVIAMISGIIVYYLIEGKIAFSFIKDFQNFNTYYIAFFFSGFSEKLVSNLMLDFEKKDKN
jgi:hypothetical protein